MQAGPDPRSPPRRILVAEDEPHIRRILATLLEASGFHVEIAVDGREAVSRLETADPFDLVVSDLMMPHLSGLDVLERMRLMGHRVDTPVVILTAKGQDADRDSAFALGAQDFMTKPFSPKKLLARIHELLGS